MKYISILLFALTLMLFGCEPEAKIDAPIIPEVTTNLQPKPVVVESDLTEPEMPVNEPKIEVPEDILTPAPETENVPVVKLVITEDVTDTAIANEKAIPWAAPKFDIGIGPNANNLKFSKYIWRCTSEIISKKAALGDNKNIETPKVSVATETPKTPTPTTANEVTKDKTPKKDDKKSGPSLEDTAFFKNCDFVFKNFVDKNGKVNYLRLRRKKLELLAAVKELGNIPTVVRLSWSEDDNKAFLLNAHNILMIKLVIDNYPIKPNRWASIFYPKSSIKHIPGARTKLFFRVAEFRSTIDEIEVELLAIAKNPNYCFALSNATVSGGKLRNEAYHPDKLNKQIDEQVKKYFSDPKNLKIDTSEKKIHLSSIFKMKNVKNSFLNSKYATIKRFREKKPENRAFLNFIFLNIDKKTAKEIESTEYKIKFETYDWLLNEK